MKTKTTELIETLEELGINGIYAHKINGEWTVDIHLKSGLYSVATMSVCDTKLITCLRSLKTRLKIQEKLDIKGKEKTK